MKGLNYKTILQLLVIIYNNKTSKLVIVSQFQLNLLYEGKAEAYHSVESPLG
jgi:hypothetical protein